MPLRWLPQPLYLSRWHERELAPANDFPLEGWVAEDVELAGGVAEDVVESASLIDRYLEASRRTDAPAESPDMVVRPFLAAEQGFGFEGSRNSTTLDGSTRFPSLSV